MKNFSVKSAFTLVEMIVAIGCVGILILVFARFLSANLKAYYQNSQRLELTDQSIGAFNHLNPDIRGAVEIISCAPNNLTFYLKIGSADATAKKLTFNLDQNLRQLTRTVIEPYGTPPNYTYPEETATSRVISSQVNNSDSAPIFSFYRGDGSLISGTCQPGLVKMIGVHLRHKGTDNYKTGEIESETRINLRNLKTNL
jgi:type II secretory pathway pseudopilin PulG